MADAPIPECPNCRRLQARIAEPEARIARLEKDSSNSHKFTRLWRAALQRHRQAAAGHTSPGQETPHRRPAGPSPAPAPAVSARPDRPDSALYPRAVPGLRRPSAAGPRRRAALRCWWRPWAGSSTGCWAATTSLCFALRSVLRRAGRRIGSTWGTWASRCSSAWRTLPGT